MQDTTLCLDGSVWYLSSLGVQEIKSGFSFFLLLCSLITFIKLQVIFADSLLEVAGFHGGEETDMWTYAWTDVSM